MQLASDILKDVIYFAAVGGGGYFLWLIIGKVVRRYSFELDRFGQICLTIFATGAVGWLLFMLYFAFTT